MLLHETVNAQRYIDVLVNPIVHPVLKQLALPLFSKHKTQILPFLAPTFRAQMEKESSGHCPHHNLIEYVWNSLGRRIFGHQPLPKP
ncbi:hypothetical protein CDAR_198341 [Caerostris darwini]|uniref:Uncharacterized protein n=1 Tax=Caerostris darwini TaxID=1538125 RepID=A0AAV4WSC1_9ARAC|nr:hypothetical protein CDAR_198341 [Caerostris darwini]